MVTLVDRVSSADAPRAFLDHGVPNPAHGYRQADGASVSLLPEIALTSQWVAP